MVSDHLMQLYKLASIEERLNNYPDATKDVLVFNKYRDISVKKLERIRRASEIVIDYVSIARHRPKTVAIMKNKVNKRKLTSMFNRTLVKSA